MNHTSDTQHETSQGASDVRPAPTPQPRAVVCPYCGVVSGNTARCHACSGRFDPLSRQATQNAMGPWFVRDERTPTLPGCSYETLVSRVEQGKITPGSVVRGPTTRQFWMLAKRTPGVSHLLGFCHACQASVDAEQYSCISCGAVFEVDRDRQHLGIGPARMLPGQGSPERVAAFTHAAHASTESPTWSWASQGPEAQTRESAPAPIAGPSGATDEGGRLRLKRLESQLLRQRHLNRVLMVICALLLIGVFAVSMVMRRPPEALPSAESSPETAVERSPEQTLSAAPEVEPATSERSEAEDAWSEPSWSSVRQRVLALVAQGSRESLSAGVLELEALQRRGALPDDGVELLERLRTEMDAGGLEGMP